MILKSARRSKRPIVIDFNFPELPSWQRAKAILEGGALRRLQNVVVTWNFENEATRLRLASWKLAATAAVVSWAISSRIAFIIWNGFAARSRASLPGCSGYLTAMPTAALC